MNEKELHSVEIAGVRLKLKSPLAPAQVQKICDLVDEQMTDLLKKSKSGSIQNIAILTALNLAEELLALKKQGQQHIDRVSSKLETLSKKLNRSIEKSARLDN